MINNNLAQVSDVQKAYLSEISKFSLLLQDEEQYYGNILKKFRNSMLLTISDTDGYDISTLNMPLLFNSLCNNIAYQSIVRDLIYFYDSIDSNDNSVVDSLKQYQYESNKRNRALNSNELKNIFGIDKTDVLDEKELLVEIKKFMNYKYAFNKIFVSNLRLVVSIAKMYNYNDDLMDLINEGNMGLMRAIEHYDASYENRFSTYAVWWIKMYIRRSTINQKSVIIPEYFHNKMLAFRKKVSELEQSEKRSLSAFEIADMLSMPVADVMRYQLYMQEDVSIDTQIVEEDDLTLGGMISSGENVEETVLKKTLHSDIEDLLDVLTEREKKVVKMRFGLGEYQDNRYLQKEISKEMSVSQQRVRQIEARALFKMKQYIKRNEKLHSLKNYMIK